VCRPRTPRGRILIADAWGHLGLTAPSDLAAMPAGLIEEGRQWAIPHRPPDPSRNEARREKLNTALSAMEKGRRHSVL